jgi:hypothetical protein
MPSVTEEECDDWAAAIAEIWLSDWNDYREDIYELDQTPDFESE